MATGIEVAGLVLGSIPLILAGLQFYAQGIAVTKRYWKYKEEVNNVLYELGAESTMYINTINMLLVGVVSQKEMTDFLADPGGTRWKEVKFDKKLRDRLGTSYDSYMESIMHLMTTAEKFKEKLKLDNAGKPQFSEQKAFKEHYKRLKFSLKKSDYSDLMGRLRRANQSLYRLTTQTAYLEARQLSSKQGNQSIPNFRVIKDRADNFYSALRTGWNCPCQADHSVSLRLEARMDDSSGDEDDEDEKRMRNPFHVLFRYNHHCTTDISPGGMTKPWTWEEADVRVEHEDQQSTAKSASGGRTGKGVRFANQAKQAVRAALEPQPDMQPIQDLCSAICTLQEHQRNVCFSLLANEIAKQKYGVHIYPMKHLPPDKDTWMVSSLRAVLDDSKFARQDRLRLAVTLASSVLQLHQTPWLEDNWGKDNIFFVKRPGKSLYDQPFVSQHFNQTESTPSVGTPSIMSRIIRNQMLYALGVALIELWYGKTLAELHVNADGPHNTGITQMDLMTEYNTADRLVDELYSEAGGKYSDAVRRCIRCDFDRRASSLEDIQFQRAVYEGVVAQLKENYEFMFQHPPD
ncbi:Nn.00g075550.m01.CDS01 [Neocucurbitaria sp. VM-36]